MYHLHATVTQDLLGWIITVAAYEHEGRKRRRLFDETWLIEAPEDTRVASDIMVRTAMTQYCQEMSDVLRRVATGVSPREARG